MGNSELIIYTDVSFKIDDVIILIKNISIDRLAEINIESVEKLFAYKWYMKGCYDRVDILDENFIILELTKKKVVLVKANG